jgi:hypothetical protein
MVKDLDLSSFSELSKNMLNDETDQIDSGEFNFTQIDTESLDGLSNKAIELNN